LGRISKTGLLWWINVILHTFGWVIVVNIEDGKIVNVYPARVKYRGFEGEYNTKGYIKVSQFMKDNVDKLLEKVEN
jgi:hypothetical protein